jgi:putative FmdB family regulatory protein
MTAEKTMPIYEYRCKSCENRFEKLRPIAEMDGPTPCPRCQSAEVLRLLSVFAAPSGGDSGEACASSIANGTTCGRVSGFG